MLHPANLVTIHPPVHDTVQTRKYHANGNADTNGIYTNNMSPSPSVGDIIIFPAFSIHGPAGMKKQMLDRL